MLNFFMPCVGGDYGTGFSGMMGYGVGGGMFGGAFMIVWWVIIIGATILLVRWAVEQSKRSGSISGKSALDILKERYAKGEINKDEFEAKKKDLA